MGFAGLLLLAFVALVVWNCVWLHRYGQTVGKRALGIRIVRGNGERASLGRIFGLRYLPMMILGAIPFLGPLVTLQPGEGTSHPETWHLVAAPKGLDPSSEASLDRELQPLLVSLS